MTKEESRRLAAVWFVDIVGYTELSSRDEDAALGVGEGDGDVLSPLLERIRDVLQEDQAEPDVDEAWRLLDRLRPHLPEAAGPLLEAQAQIVVGGMIGLAGLPDSAMVVMERARLGPRDDPERELMSIEAAMYARHCASWTLRQRPGPSLVVPRPPGQPGLREPELT